ncbi:MAG TPA: hypothetical protein VHA56_16265 [Mucilaginibacter sp.]|nr:hypothetical protein [Mucilaginibacter sp.]
MTNQDKYLYSLKKFVVLVKDMRQSQDHYRQLLVVYSQSRNPDDRDTAEMVYAKTRRMEKVVDETIDEIMRITDIPAEPAPISEAKPAGHVGKVVLAAGSAVVLVAIDCWAGFFPALIFLVALAVTLMIGIIIYYHKQSKTDPEDNIES